MTQDETTQRPRKARKSHKCVECEWMIAPGVEYIASSLKVGGRFDPIARHKDCLAFADMREIKEALMTDEGYRLHLAAGLKTRDIGGLIAARAKAFPDVLERIKSAGLLK